jgi:triose/dihydroxyacetone kinase / FAD-AMP lyase (cyclizing)
MGGTSGALYSIYLSALAQGVALAKESRVTLSVIAKASEFALAALGKYTPARVGDRTLVDALDPFVQALNESHDLRKAVEAARKGYSCSSWAMLIISAGETSKMTARLGRASYVGGESLPPDPGAVGVAALVEGIANALQ